MVTTWSKWYSILCIQNPLLYVAFNMYKWDILFSSDWHQCLQCLFFSYFQYIILWYALAHFLQHKHLISLNLTIIGLFMGSGVNFYLEHVLGFCVVTEFQVSLLVCQLEFKNRYLINLLSKDRDCMCFVLSVGAQNACNPSFFKLSYGMAFPHRSTFFF